MAVLTFPLALADFFDLLPISRCAMEIPEALDIAETENGELITADFGTALWSGQIDLTTVLQQEAAALRPLLNVLRRGGTSFFVADATRPWPRLDPKGLVLSSSASVPSILAIGGTSRELSLTGLPAWYPISRGDLISFSYGASPTRYGLHEFVGAGSANQSGQTGLLEVTPPLRAGVAGGTAVQLVWPSCKARLVPGSLDTGTSKNTITSDMTFRWRQTLR